MYALRPHETIYDGVQSAVRKGVHGCVQLLASESSDTIDDKAVHSIRTRVKKLRTLIRLVRFDLGDRRYRRGKACLHETGNALSAIRDAKVVLSTCERLVRRWDGVDCHPLFTALQEGQAKTRLAPSPDKRRLLAKRLRAFEQLLSTCPESRPESKSLKRGLRHIYTAGCMALELCGRAPSEAHFHELRKSAKDLLYTCAFLRKASGAASSMLKELRQFTALLGRDHDLTLMRHVASEDGAPQQAYLRNLTLDQQRLLRQRAWRIGLRLYARPPGPFVNWLLRGWKKGPANAGLAAMH